MFVRLGEALTVGGRALIVANHTLPYERGLGNAGSTEVLSVGRGYKIIAFTRIAKARAPSRGREPRPWESPRR
jgi:16S rRNA G1207 methylase RsmC